MNTGGAAGEDDPFGLKRLYGVKGHVERVDFAVDVAFAYPAGDELRVLGTEIQNQNPFFMELIE